MSHHRAWTTASALMVACLTGCSQWAQLMQQEPEANPPLVEAAPPRIDPVPRESSSQGVPEAESIAEVLAFVDRLDEAAANQQVADEQAREVGRVRST